MDNTILIYTAVTSLTTLSLLFYSDKKLQSQVKKYFSYKNSDDLIQEVYLMILNQKEPDNLIQIAKDNKFQYWLFSCLKNQRDDKYSRYNTLFTNKKLNSHSNQLQYIADTTTENSFELQIEKENKLNLEEIIKDELSKIDKKKWYDIKIFYNYVQFLERCQENDLKPHFGDFSKEMNIEYNSLYATIKRVQTKIKRRLKNEL